MSPYRLDDASLEALLGEDAPQGDATTAGLGIAGQAGRMEFRARGPMTLCASEEAARLGELRGLRICGPVRHSGERLDAGETILAFAGEAGALHQVWKTAQTLIEYLSGTASACTAILDAARRINPEIGLACTRKNFPGTKRLSLKAVLCAGASPHRLSLSETLLVFAEHRSFLGAEAPAASLRRLRRQWPERLIVVEVSDQAEALSWAEAGADILQLERFTPEALADLKNALGAGGRPRLAAAGGVNAQNAAAYAAAGADLLVSSAPYFAPPRDVAVSLFKTMD